MYEHLRRAKAARLITGRLLVKAHWRGMTVYSEMEGNARRPPSGIIHRL
jgi:hypothetical protein